MLVELVVGVEHEVGLIVVGHTGVEHVSQQMGQRIPFADQFEVVAFDHVAAQ